MTRPVGPLPDEVPDQLPGQTGKVVVVTGANSGIGYFTSEQLAAAGAHVVLACRSRERGRAALSAIRGRVAGASVELLDLDVTDPESIRAAADVLAARRRLDALVENAGMVHPPAKRETDARGNELVFSTNVLGHFSLTALLYPTLAATAGSRVVVLGSMASRLSTFRIDDLQLVRGYTGWRAYAQSKIAVQVFGFELDRRLRLARSGVTSLVAHPGYSISGRTPRIQGVNEPTRMTRFVDNLQALGTQGKDRGAWPVVRAVTDPDAQGGDHWGPRYLTRGVPTRQRPTSTSRDPQVGSRLWSRLEEFTGMRFDVS
ncbi:SDR family NAD(P)-dependent oxidoreductase [Diaminobutyricibacter sp. McL0608]|uniref:SDR family NAD(P)-dependent oxidoreductase n=1 Tax=Leifsonia sp. McL0608 TaxID=3143537 RepID=UPI0031F31869